MCAKHIMISMDSIDQYVMATVAMNDPDIEAIPDNPIRGKTWLHKIMYIASKQYGDNRFGFKPHKQGVYSSAVEKSLARCAQNGLICMHNPDGEGVIHITDGGKEALDPDKCDDNLLRQLQTTKSLLNGLDYRQMIVYSYALFPEMTKLSEIVDSFESWRMEETMAMYLKGSISFALAATISGLGRIGFENHVRDMGMEPYSGLVRTKVVIPMKRPEF